MNESEAFTFNESSTCVRCKIKPSDFVCEACDPYKFFCSNCDGYVHSLPSKREHQRALIEHGYSERRTEYNTINNHSKTLNSTIEQVNRYNDTPERLASFLSKESPGDINTGYIREIRKAHERERDELREEIDNIRSLLGDKILNLQSQIEENNDRYSNTLRNVEEEYKIIIRNITTDKDNEILTLRKGLNEMEKVNSELKKQVNECNAIIEEQKNSFNTRLAFLDDDLKLCEKETIELKEHYEERINFLIEQFTQEKTKLISEYENNIEK
jgi:hypothetical protein